MLKTSSEIVDIADRHDFAVPAINISDFVMLQACLETAEEQNSPLILLIHPNEWALVGNEFVKATLRMAETVRVPIAVHLDHSDSYYECVQAVRIGFTGVMVDGSHLPYDENLSLSREVVKVGNAASVSVEAEIGSLGPRDPKNIEEAKLVGYTSVEEATRFAQECTPDLLAVAVGTTHGIYPKGFKPNIRPDLVEQIRKSVAQPLVLHGGSGAPDDKVRLAVANGISKVNLSADLKTAYFSALRNTLKDDSLREPQDIYPAPKEAVKQVITHKMSVCGSVRKSYLY